MVAWMDDEALHRTLTTGRATYWSRSRREYWVKGATSGHHQYVRSVALDCDGDALLVSVDQVGAACHTGHRTCFFTELPVTGQAQRMTDGAVSPTSATFTELAARWRVVPVTRRLLADAETPVGVYRKLAGGPGTFLLESAEQGVGSAGMAWSRYSFIGVRSSATLVERDGEAAWLGQPPAGRADRRRPGARAAGDRRGAGRPGPATRPTACRR